MGKIVRQVDEYEKESDAQCKKCKGNCSFEGMGGTWQCYGFVPKTNFDNIKAMNIEELAKLFYLVQSEGCGYELCIKKEPKETDEETCIRCWGIWLRKEAEDE